MYNPVLQPIPLPPNKVRRFKRAYAGHLLELRGYVTGSTAPEPDQKFGDLKLDAYHVKVGDNVRVSNALPSLPLLAHVGNVQAESSAKILLPLSSS